MATPSTYREWLVQAHHTASQDYDKAVMWLAGGALALSITFVHDVAPQPTRESLLAYAWGFLAASLVLILSSFLTSQVALARMIDHVDRAEPPEDAPRGWRKVTYSLNGASGLALVIGIGLLAKFAFYNL